MYSNLTLRGETKKNNRIQPTISTNDASDWIIVPKIPRSSTSVSRMVVRHIHRILISSVSIWGLLEMTSLHTMHPYKVVPNSLLSWFVTPITMLYGRCIMMYLCLLWFINQLITGGAPLCIDPPDIKALSHPPLPQRSAPQLRAGSRRWSCRRGRCPGSHRAGRGRTRPPAASPGFLFLSWMTGAWRIGQIRVKKKEYLAPKLANVAKLELFNWFDSIGFLHKHRCLGISHSLSLSLFLSLSFSKKCIIDIICDRSDSNCWYAIEI